jgi:hypothetical protein
VQVRVGVRPKEIWALGLGLWTGGVQMATISDG